MPSLDEWIAFSDGLADRALLEALGVHRTTLMRWRLGRARIPRAARELIAIHYKGELPPGAHRGWRGWRFGHDGLLYAPDLARGFSADDLRELHWLRQAASWREARARVIERAGLPASPAPDLTATDCHHVGC